MDVSSQSTLMGIVIQEVTFDAPAPAAEVIAARVTELVGLPVIVRESPPELRGALHDLHAQIAFQANPKAEVELTAYRAGAVKEHLRLTGMDAMSTASVVEGSKEAVGKQTVYVRGYVGQEPTLLLVTTLALEALGGQLREPMPDDVRREYSRSVSADELRRRHRKMQRQGLLKLAAGVLLLPVLVPVGIVRLAWRLMTMPRRIWKAHQLAKKQLPG